MCLFTHVFLVQIRLSIENKGDAVYRRKERGISREYAKSLTASRRHHRRAMGYCPLPTRDRCDRQIPILPPEQLAQPHTDLTNTQANHHGRNDYLEELIRADRPDRRLDTLHLVGRKVEVVAILVLRWVAG